MEHPAMALQPRQREVVEEVVRQLMGEAQGQPVKRSKCPYGCDDTQINVHGYCRHLVGFCSDGKTVEVRGERSSGEYVCGTECVRDDDVLVPSYSRIDPKSKGKVVPTTLRVYRQNGEAPQVTAETASLDVLRLTAAKRALEDKLAAAQLQEEQARLRQGRELASVK